TPKNLHHTTLPSPQRGGLHIRAQFSASIEKTAKLWRLARSPPFFLLWHSTRALSDCGRANPVSNRPAEESVPCDFVSLPRHWPDCGRRRHGVDRNRRPWPKTFSRMRYATWDRKTDRPGARAKSRRA